MVKRVIRRAVDVDGGARARWARAASGGAVREGNHLPGGDCLQLAVCIGTRHDSLSSSSLASFIVTCGRGRGSAKEAERRDARQPAGRRAHRQSFIDAQ